MMKISESTPVVRMAKFTGLAPSRPATASHARRIKGTAQLSKTIDLSKRPTFLRPLVIRPQVHSRVKVAHLVGVAVEQECRPAARLADALLGRLTPTRMGHLWVYVG